MDGITNWPTELKIDWINLKLTNQLEKKKFRENYAMTVC